MSACMALPNVPVQSESVAYPALDESKTDGRPADCLIPAVAAPSDRPGQNRRVARIPKSSGLSDRAYTTDHGAYVGLTIPV